MERRANEGYLLRTSGLASRASIRSWEKRTGVSLRAGVLVGMGLRIWWGRPGEDMLGAAGGRFGGPLAHDGP